jgi:predicted Zn-dependent protease
MPNLLRRCVIGLLCLLAVAHAASAGTADDLPTLEDSSDGIVSSAVEKQLGERFLRQLRHQAPLSDDAVIRYYSTQLLAELAAEGELKDPTLQVAMIDVPQLNAFAAPGGVVGINLGLYLHATNVHEFAAVLAHELGHLSQRHFARGVEFQQKQALPLLAAMLASIAVGMAAGGDAGMAALTSSQALAQDQALRYSRGREQEADRVGIDTLARAGFAPQAMASMFERMQDAARFDRRPPEFLLTHPVTGSRISDARNQAAHRAQGVMVDRVDYQMVRSRVRVQYAASPAAAVDMFADEVRRGHLPRAAAVYGHALALSRAGRHREALSVLAGIGETKGTAALFRTLLEAELQLAAGEPAHAREVLAHALDVNPDNTPLAMAYATALRHLSQFRDALLVLHRQAMLYPDDDQVWYELAETAGLAGDIVTVHEARAEYFYLHGDFERAIEHLRYAERLVADDQYQRREKLRQRASDIAKVHEREREA